MKKQGLSPRTKDILELLGAGVLLTSLFIAPGVAVGIDAIVRAYQKAKREKDWKEWEKYDLTRLKYLLKRMERQKVICFDEDSDGATLLRLTEKGKLRTLKYHIADMTLHQPDVWDRKWRVIIYDIVKFKKRERNMFRGMLKKLKMLPLQKSVYLTPFPCENEIEFLRRYFDVGSEVLLLTVSTIENESVYKNYFGLHS